MTTAIACIIQRLVSFMIAWFSIILVRLPSLLSDVVELSYNPLHSNARNRTDLSPYSTLRSVALYVDWAQDAGEYGIVKCEIDRTVKILGEFLSDAVSSLPMSVSTLSLSFALMRSKLEVHAQLLRDRMDWARLQDKILKKLDSGSNLKRVVVVPASGMAAEPDLVVDTMAGLGFESCLSCVCERGVLYVRWGTLCIECHTSGHSDASPNSRTT